MIGKVTLENFFSFGDATTVELNPDVNILVGINGSGKSNFLKAIRLLYEAVVGDGFEKLFLREWSGFVAVGNFNESRQDTIRLIYEFDKNSLRKAADGKGFAFEHNPIYEISIIRSGAANYYLKERFYSKNEDNSLFIFMEMQNGEGVISTNEKGVELQKYPQEHKQLSFKPTELVLRQISDPDRFYPLFTLKRALEGVAVYDYFDTTLKSPIRQPASHDTEKRLAASGQNLMSVLLKIKNHHSLKYENIEKYIRNINPFIKDITFDFLGSKLFLVLREKYLSKGVSIEHISDGTLRYLILLSILFNPNRGNPVCMDEPEIGLHPDMINSVAQAVKTAAGEGEQLIIATHSPLLLNAFELDQLIIFEKNAENQTLVSYKSEDDFENWNENFLSGQLWLSGKIGGKRW